MTIYRVDTILQYQTDLPRDVSVNSFHTVCDDITTGTILDDTIAAFVEFWTTSENIDSPGEWISPYVTRNANASRIVVRQVGVAGPPLADEGFTLPAAKSSTSLPFEVAVCMSFKGAAPDVPAARQRGRVFIGPLVLDALDSGDADTTPSVEEQCREDIAANGNNLQSGLALAGNPWVVYSRVLDAGTLVAAGWVDDEFDTQRRRQVPASVRSTW